MVHGLADVAIAEQLKLSLSISLQQSYNMVGLIKSADLIFDAVK